MEKLREQNGGARGLSPSLVLEASKVLIDPIFWNHRNFELERDTPD